ncbi:MAG: HEAT repeat domain-containing protein [Treponema sp.]|nr:HEAT repeat domain-containing protein [Treponema sp.]
MKKHLVFPALFFTLRLLYAQEGSGPQDPVPGVSPVPAVPGGNLPQKSIEEQRRDTLLYGTETEVAALIQTLTGEGTADFDEPLITLVETSRNRTIISGIFGFFSGREQPGLENRALRALGERDEEANETILAAVEYLGKLGVGEGIPALEELITGGENRFLNAAFRALGRIAGKRAAPKGGEDSEAPSGDAGKEAREISDRAAEFLTDYYINKDPGDENRRELIVALGETLSKNAVPLLADLAVNEEERAPLRMAALGSLAKIGDAAGLEAVIKALSSTDPNVRSAAVGALAPFTGKPVDAAILDGLRDSYYRTRLAAAEAAKTRKLESAVPYLRFRAERDEVPAVRDEAIRALGAIGTKETTDILYGLFKEKKNADRLRLSAAEMLCRKDPDNLAPLIILELEEAKRKNQPLYNGFLRVLGNAETPKLEELARSFLSAGGVVEKSLALDISLKNEYRSLAEEIRALLDPKRGNQSLARKAQATLEKLGIEKTGEGES